MNFCTSRGCRVVFDPYLLSSVCSFKDGRRFIQIVDDTLLYYEISTTPQLTHRLLHRQDIARLLPKYRSDVSGITLACDDNVLLISCGDRTIYYGNVKPTLINLQELEFDTYDIYPEDCSTMDPCRTRPMVLVGLYSGAVLSIHFNHKETWSAKFIEKIRVKQDRQMVATVVEDELLGAVCYDLKVC